MQRQYEKQLKGIAKHIDELVRRFEGAAESRMPSLVDLLRAYADGLKPWAMRVGARMIAGVDNREREAWRATGNAISAAMHQTLHKTPAGGRAKSLLAEQVDLITSLPLEAAERVHHLTVKGLESAVRSPAIAGEIMRTGEVTRSRAILIARTEIGRTQVSLLQARCEAIGSTHYIWRTAEDGDVRPGHKAMEGKVCSWESPPAVNENGRVMHHHPGAIWNCRCWSEPVIPTPK